jgi:hypothetical protein
MNRFALLAVLAIFTAGITSAPAAHANESLTNNCLVEGDVNLTINGSETFGSISGWIGQTNFYGRVHMGRVDGNLGSISFMNLFLNTINRGDFQLSGWIGNTSVSWRSFGSWINAGYVCLN